MSLFELISSAHAQSAAAPAAGGGSMSDLLQGPLPMFVIIGLIFYFLLIRPQNQKAKALRAQLTQLKRGDSVVTSGGIIGTVSRVISDDELTIEIAEGVRVRVVRSTITGLTAKGEPRTDAKNAAADKDDETETAAPKLLRRGKPAPANESKP